MVLQSILTVLLLASSVVPRYCAGAGLNGLEKEGKKGEALEQPKAAGAAAKDNPSLEVRDGVVFYEGRNLDESLKTLHQELDKASMERDKLLLDLSGKADAKRLVELEKRIKGLEYQTGKYAALRKKGRLLVEEQEESSNGGAKPPAQEAAGATTSGPRGATVRPRRGNPAVGTAGRNPPTGSTGAAIGPGNDPEVPPQLLESQLDASGVGRTLSGMRTDAGALDQGYKETEDGFPGVGDGPGRIPPSGRGVRSSGGARAPGFDGAGAPQNLSDPATPQDLVLAAMSGYRGSLRDLGLQVGTGPDGRPAILRRSGASAGAGELQALRERIRSEPRALLQRPDFFQVLGRPRYAELKQAYGARSPQDQAFRHIALADDERDFLWSATCARLSGDCNPRVPSASYAKGQHVPPEDLRAVYESLDDEGEWDLDDDSDLEEARDKLSRRAFGRDGGLRGLLGSIGRFFSGSEEAPAASGGGGTVLNAESRAPGDAPTPDTLLHGSGAARGHRGDATAAVGRPAGVPAVPPRRNAPGSRWGLWIAAAVGAILLIRVGLFRRPASRE